MNSHFTGLGVALVTPFHEDKSIDFEGLERVVESCIQSGVNYLVSLGTTGEAITLSTKEQQAVLSFTHQVNKGRVPLVAGVFGHNDTQALIERFQLFDLTGYDAILSSSPSYNKPSQEGIFQHYMQLEKHSPLPIIIYNVPSRTASKISTSTLLRLAHASEKFVGVKDATGNLIDAAKIAKDKPSSFQLISGDDPTALPLFSVGGTGLISVLGNLLPGPYSQMVNAALEGDYETARKIHLATITLHKLLYCEGNPVGIKMALQMAGFCSHYVRLPLVGMSEGNTQKLKKSLSDALALLKNPVS